MSKLNDNDFTRVLKMKILLNNFCIYDKPFEIEFDDFKTCLLNADSGKGKTTILEAIKFCFYGGTSNFYPSGMDPKDKKNEKCSVTIILPEYNGLKITRVKPPERLKLKKKKLELEDEEAQEYIYKTLGNLQMFYATSYLPQGQRHQLISLSNKEKFDLLSMLTFGLNEESHPDSFMKKLDYKLRENEKKLEEKVVRLNIFQHEVKKLEKTEYLPELTEEEIGVLREELTKTSQELEVQEKAQRKAEEIDFKLSSLQDRDFELSSEQTDLYPTLKDLDLEEYETFLELDKFFRDKNFQLSEQKSSRFKKSEIENVFKEWENFHAYSDELEQVSSSLKEIDYEFLMAEKEKYQLLATVVLPSFYIPEDDPLLKYLDLDLDDLDLKLKCQIDYSQLKEYYSFLQLKEKNLHLKEFFDCKKSPQRIKNKISLFEKSLSEKKTTQELKIEHTPEAVQKWVKDAKYLLDHQEEFKRWETLIEEESSLIEKIQELNEELAKIHPFLTKYQVSSEQELTEAEGEGYECPECQAKLMFRQGSLLKRCREPIPEKAILELRKFFKKVTNSEREKQLCQDKLNRLLVEKDQFPLIPEKRKILSSKEASKIKDVIEKMEKFTFDKFTKDLEYYQKQLEWSKMVKNFSSVKSLEVDVTQLEKILAQKKLFKHLSADEEEEIYLSISRIREIQKWYPIQKAVLKVWSKIKTYPSHSKKELETLLDNYQELTVKEKFLTDRLKKIDPKKIFKTLTLEEWQAELTAFEYQETLEKYQVWKALEYYHPFKKYSKKELLFFQKTIPQYLKIQSEITELTEARKNIFYHDISELTDRKAKLTKKIAVMEKTLIYSQAFKKFETVSTELKNLEARKNGLDKIKMLAHQARNQALANFVRHFTIQTNKILEELFDDPLTIEIKLEKQNKSNEKIKICVNFSITYRGCIFDTPNHLSGGERDRLSLALMMGLANSAGTKMVLLDECLASLNEELRLRCIQVINKYLSGKTVVNICHSITQGFHDTTISL